MAGTKRPRSSVIPHAEPRTINQITPHADANTPEEIPVPATPTAPYVFTTATDPRFDTLDLIRVNTLGGTVGQASMFSGIDKTLGFYDLNFKSIGVSGDLELTDTPTSVILSLKQPEVVPTFIQSGTNLTQSGGLIYKGTNGDVLEFRTIGVGAGLTLQQTGTQVVLGLGFTPATGDITGGTNLGTNGANIFHSKSGTNLQFRSLISANNIIGIAPNSSDTQIVLNFNENQISLANVGGLLPANRVNGLSPIATNPDYNLLNNRPTIPTRLTDLQDVSGTPTNNDILRYVSGTGWVSSAPGIQNAFNRVRVGATQINAAPDAMDLTFAAGDGIQVDAASATRTITYGLRRTGVTAGSFLNANIVVDEYGRIMTATSGSAGSAGFEDPMTTIGDMIYRNSANQTARLRAGSNGQVLTIDFGVPTWRTPAAGGGGSVNSVNITGRNGIESTGGPITNSGSITVGLAATGVAAGTYTAATIRVDAYGRITMASNNTIVSGARRINTGYGLDGGGELSADLTLSLQKSGAVAGTYTNPTLRVDEYGRILQVSGGSGGGGGGISSITFVGQGGINITGSPVTTSGTVTVVLTNTGITPGQYTNPTLQVNAQGRITSITSGGGGSGGGDITLDGNLVAGDTGEPIANSFGGVFLPILPRSALASRTHVVNLNKDQGMLVVCSDNYWIFAALGETPTAQWIPMGYGSGMAGLPAAITPQ